MNERGYDVVVKIASDDRPLKWSRYTDYANAYASVARWHAQWPDDKIWIVDRASKEVIHRRNCKDSDLTELTKEAT